MSKNKVTNLLKWQEQKRNQQYEKEKKERDELWAMEQRSRMHLAADNEFELIREKRRNAPPIAIADYYSLLRSSTQSEDISWTFLFALSAVVSVDRDGMWLRLTINARRELMTAGKLNVKELIEALSNCLKHNILKATTNPHIMKVNPLIIPKLDWDKGDEWLKKETSSRLNSVLLKLRTEDSSFFDFPF